MSVFQPLEFLVILGMLWGIYGQLCLIVKIMDRVTGYSARESLTDGWRAGVPK
jgi:hypothetical protein